ncbi:MAG TPA: ATP-binding protein, partial [Actinomycetota bacterium]
MTTPLYGRELEVRVSGDAGRSLLAGRGGILFVIGQPGLGKTRLLSELRDLVRADGVVTWLEGRCVSYGEALPYWPFQDLLRRWLSGGVVGPPDPLTDELAHRIRK